MGNNSDNLAVNLHNLRIVGIQKLPELALHYSQSTRDLHNAGYHRDPEAPAMGNILAFRDMIQDFLAATFTSLSVNANALVTIADEYAKTDQEAADRMRYLWDERISDPVYNRPLPPVPQPKLSADENYETYRVVEFRPDPTSPSGVVEVESQVPVR